MRVQSDTGCTGSCPMLEARRQWSLPPPPHRALPLSPCPDVTADHTADTGINHPDPPPPSSFVSKGNKGGPGQPGSVGEQGTRGAQVSTPGEAACLVTLSQMLSLFVFKFKRGDSQFYKTEH